MRLAILVSLALLLLPVAAAQAIGTDPTPAAPLPPKTDQTAIIVPIPAAEPLLDPSGRLPGLPAHVTVLWPFLDPDDLTGAVRARLLALFAQVHPFNVTLDRPGRFPGVLFVDPEPADAFRDLTVEVARRWPEAPPFKGLYSDITPHVTVARGDGAFLDMVQAGLVPVHTQVSEAAVYVHDADGHWERLMRLPFAGR
jgi:2'-5' RNA ligase